MTMHQYMLEVELTAQRTGSSGCSMQQCCKHQGVLMPSALLAQWEQQLCGGVHP